jgi:phosphoribosyl 1,2-cyclic phosphate phosphodiesterase
MVPPYTRTPPGKVDLWGNAATIQRIRERVPPVAHDALVLHTIEAGDAFETAQGDKVLALPAAHAEGAMLFRITRGGRTLFYGHDSSLYPQATLEALADGRELDIALFDCNHGGARPSNKNHMGIAGVLQMAEALRQSGAITDRTRCIATHFSHNGGVFHEELVRAFLPHRIEVAYDGMLVEV